jgi:hypothetical protein
MSHTSQQELDQVIAADTPHTPEAHWINNPQQDDAGAHRTARIARALACLPILALLLFIGVTAPGGDVASSSAAVADNGPTGFFPDQIVLHAGEPEPLPAQF